MYILHDTIIIFLPDLQGSAWHLPKGTDSHIFSI